jgi:hypothetical protein
MSKKRRIENIPDNKMLENIPDNKMLENIPDNKILEIIKESQKMENILNKKEINEIKNILAIIDTFHDFNKLDYNNKYLDYFKNYYLKFDEISKNTFLSSHSLLNFIKVIGNKTDVNTENFKEKIKKIIIKNNIGFELVTIQSVIIHNFDFVFNISLPYSDKYIKDIVSREDKILLRQPLYYLIKNKDDKLMTFFIKYFRLDFFNKYILEIIYEQIKINIESIKEYNITYPSTFIDDMSSGIKDDEHMHFKMINADHEIIDQSKVEGKKSYLDNSNPYYHFKINGNQSLGVNLQDDNEIIFLDIKFKKSDNGIICSYDNIKLEIYNNSKKNIISTVRVLCYIIDKSIKNMSEQKKLIEGIINIEYLDDFLRKLDDKYKLDSVYNNLNKFGLITAMLFGAKRYGDWIQVNLAKKYYFILQTKDLYCKLYSYISGAPVIIDNKIYNFNHKELVDKLVKIEGPEQTKMTDTEVKPSGRVFFKNLEKENLTFYDIHKIDTEFSRYYFDKYKKYKKKYLLLKNEIKKNILYNNVM